MGAAVLRFASVPAHKSPVYPRSGATTIEWPMLTRIDLRGVDRDVRSRLPRPHDRETAPIDAVREILAEVRKRGDAAVREYTQRFDGVALEARLRALQAGRAA